MRPLANLDALTDCIGTVRSMLSSTAEARTANIGIDTRWTGTSAAKGSFYIGSNANQ